MVPSLRSGLLILILALPVLAAVRARGASIPTALPLSAARSSAVAQAPGGDPEGERDWFASCSHFTFCENPWGYIQCPSAYGSCVATTGCQSEACEFSGIAKQCEFALLESCQTLATPIPKYCGNKLVGVCISVFIPPLDVCVCGALFSAGVTCDSIITKCQ